MPPKDPAAPRHHLRIETPALDPVVEALSTFEWAKSVVKHLAGKKGEHPHLHIWLEFEKPLTKVAAKDRLRKHSDVFKSLSGNENWSFRPHDDYEAWCKYVCRNDSHSIIKGDDLLDQIHDEVPKVPIVVDGPLRSPNCPPARVIKSRIPMREKFIQYLERDRYWKRGKQFSMLDKPLGWWDEFENEVVDAATEYWEAAFTVPEGIRMVKHAMWVFSDEDTRSTIQIKNRSAIKKSLW